MLPESKREEAISADHEAEQAENLAIELILRKRRHERNMELEREKKRHDNSLKIFDNLNSNNEFSMKDNKDKICFIPKKERSVCRNENEYSERKQTHIKKKRKKESKDNNINNKFEDNSHLTSAQLLAIKKLYLGESALQDEKTKAQLHNERKRRSRYQKRITFKFDWDKSEDTMRNEEHDLYYGELIDNIYPTTNSRGAVISPSINSNGIHNTRNLTKSKHNRPTLISQKGKVKVNAEGSMMNVKPLSEMTIRDWRIYRENFDIVVKGGKAPPPLRSFTEIPIEVPTIHPVLLNAIKNILRYKEPTPIQKQAISIGLQRRDLIGIAETGSGKTAAFAIPLCHSILSLPKNVTGIPNVSENGPLALVMAPTRELALQIEFEISRLLSRQRNIRTVAVVGGQPIQTQAMVLRNGIHIVVGTPGRINDCIEMTYLVLNQCSYIVLDEADRMIDLGFAPQIEEILDNMGGLLKSDDESLAYKQEKEDIINIINGVPKHRLTAMFSATMPPEVESIAKSYLRHPAIVTIGDHDSGKNNRITQNIIFLSSTHMKENALRDMLLNTRTDDKVIVFVNEKKHADGTGRMVERIGRRCVVLHGGKSQEQREENLDIFKRGGVVLVATDVAGRGLDIPDVKHVINYDMPTRSIDNYCHRIGRTGRAGKMGIATSFITDEDEGILPSLVLYLESTGAHVPERLANHPSLMSLHQNMV